MILINIDSLSLQELKSIAAQEGIDNYEVLGREELIDRLTEIYEDEDDGKELNAIGDVNKRFISGLVSDFRGEANEVTSLPGVEELPSVYPETSIHLLFKNASWLYCYWSVASFALTKLEEQHGPLSFLLKATIHKGKEGVDEIFDIPVSNEDMEWNIGIPTTKGYAQVVLVGIDGKGERYDLATSEKVSLIDCYWIDNPEEIGQNDALMRAYLSLITNKEGRLLAVEPVHEILGKIGEEEGLTWNK